MKRVLLAWAAMCVMGALAAAQPYQIRLHRPEKAGDRYRLQATGTSARSMDLVVDGQAVQSQYEGFRVDLEATAEVKQVSEDGTPLAVNYTIGRFTRQEGKEEGKPLLAPGAVVESKLEGDARTFTVGGDKADAVVSAALDLVLGSRAKKESKDDLMFGTDKPVNVGDQWPVNAEASARELANEEVKVAAQDIRGTMTLADAREVRGTPALVIEGQIEVAKMQMPLPPDVKADRAKADLKLQVALPRDVAQPPLTIRREMKMDVKATGRTPDGKSLVMEMAFRQMVETMRDEARP